MKNITFSYTLEGKEISFRHVEYKLVDELAKQLYDFKLDLTRNFAEEEFLLDLYSSVNRVLFNLCHSIMPYSSLLDKNLSDMLLNKFKQAKLGYPDLFQKMIIPIVKTVDALRRDDENVLYDFICTYLNENPKNYKKISIITKRSLNYSEKEHILHRINPELNISFYTENGYRKTQMIFDETIFLGSSNFFSSFSSQVFKSYQTTFISYSFFLHKNRKTSAFPHLPTTELTNTIQKGIIFNNQTFNKEIIEIKEENTIHQVIKSIIKEQENIDQGDNHRQVVASIIFIESDRFLFVSRDANVRILSLHDRNEFVKQIHFKDLQEDDYLIIRNDWDTKLIAEVADKKVLKDNATQYRGLQEDWKKRLRNHVNKLGAQRVSKILSQKYNMKTASSVSVRNWCTEESICPQEISALLKALKYKNNEIENIYSAMKEIQNAHRQAGRIITRSLMNELKEDIFEKLNEQGYYTFNSNTFNGASFNIERVISIDNTKYSIFYYDLMKPINANRYKEDSKDVY